MGQNVVYQRKMDERRSTGENLRRRLGWTPCGAAEVALACFGSARTVARHANGGGHARTDVSSLCAARGAPVLLVEPSGDLDRLNTALADRSRPER